MFDPEPLIFSLSRTLDLKDRPAFEADAAYNVGPGVAFRTLRPLWRRFFKPPDAMRAINVDFVSLSTRADAYDEKRKARRAAG